MTALSADAPLRLGQQVYTRKLILNTSAAQTVYKGQPLYINQTLDAVNVTAHIDITHPEAVAADDAFVGIAAEGKAVAASATEDAKTAGVIAYVEPSIIGFKSTVFTNASIGLGVYMPDSATLAGVASAADCPYIGILQYVEDGYAYVKLVSQVCSGA